MKNTIKFALVGALLAVAAPVASASDSHKVSKQVMSEVTAQPEQVLAIVAKQIAANKGSACEVVKAAIVATEADKNQVAQIVEQAIKLVPGKVTLLTTCALAVAPDAHVEVMKVAANYVAKSNSEFNMLEKSGAPRAGDTTPLNGAAGALTGAGAGNLGVLNAGLNPFRSVVSNLMVMTSRPVTGAIGGEVIGGVGEVTEAVVKRKGGSQDRRSLSDAAIAAASAAASAAIR